MSKTPISMKKTEKVMRPEIISIKCSSLKEMYLVRKEIPGYLKNHMDSACHDFINNISYQLSSHQNTERYEVNIFEKEGYMYPNMISQLIKYHCENFSRLLRMRQEG